MRDFNVSSSIYLALDMMNDLVHPDGPNGKAAYGEQARAANSPIFSNARKNGIFKLGEWGTQVHPDLGQQPTDFDIVKHRVSPFHGTDLEVILRTHDVRRIYCSGISTNAVVQAAVREGHDRDYQMVLLEDCCCALSAEEHESAIKLLQRFCRVTTSAEVVFE
jgi:nicotinamidase-related amidase